MRNTQPQREVRSESRAPTPTREKAARPGEKAANARRDAREQRLRAQRRKLYLKWTLIVAAIVGVLLGLAAIYQSDVFHVAHVEVAGNEALTKDDVLALAAMPDSATLLRFPGAGVKERLEASPWIAGATVTRDFPDTARIRVEERRPIALVDVEDAAFWLIDREGYMIAESAPATDTATVVIRDVVGLDPQAGSKTLSEPLLNALAIWEGLSPELRSRVRAISAPSIDKTALITTDDIEIFVGEATDMETKNVVVQRILEEQAGKVVYINVRSVDRPTWRGVEGE